MSVCTFVCMYVCTGVAFLAGSGWVGGMYLVAREIFVSDRGVLVYMGTEERGCVYSFECLWRLNIMKRERN